MSASTVRDFYLGNIKPDFHLVAPSLSYPTIAKNFQFFKLSLQVDIGRSDFIRALFKHA